MKANILFNANATITTDKLTPTAEITCLNEVFAFSNLASNKYPTPAIAAYSTKLSAKVVKNSFKYAGSAAIDPPLNIKLTIPAISQLLIESIDDAEYKFFNTAIL